MQGKLAHTSDTTPAHVLVASPAIKEDLVEKRQVRCVEVSSLEEVGVADNTAQSTSASVCAPAYSLPPHEVNVRIADRVTEARVIDPGLQIVVIREDLAQEVGATIATSRVLQMEGTNGATNWTLGCAEFFSMCTGDIAFEVHAYIVEHAPVTVAWPQVIKDPDKPSRPFHTISYPLLVCFSLIKLLIICLTGDGQDFDPPRGVRGRIVLDLHDTIPMSRVM